MEHSKINQENWARTRRNVIINRGKLNSHTKACKNLGIGTTTGYLLLRSSSFRHYSALRRRESGKSYAWRDRLVIAFNGR